MAAWIRKPRRPLEVVLGLLLAVAVMASAGVIAWRVQHPTPGEAFTEFYVLGEEWRIEDYPTLLYMGQSQEYNVGIVNHEGEVVTYTIRAFLDDVPVGLAGPLTLKDGDEREGQISVTPASAGEQQKLELWLYRDTETEVYRRVHLFVNVETP